jgi:hypothetical protein
MNSNIAGEVEKMKNSNKNNKNNNNSSNNSIRKRVRAYLSVVPLVGVGHAVSDRVGSHRGALLGQGHRGGGREVADGVVVEIFLREVEGEPVVAGVVEAVGVLEGLELVDGGAISWVVVQAVQMMKQQQMGR